MLKLITGLCLAKHFYKLTDILKIQCYYKFIKTTKMIARLLGDTERMVSDVYSHILEEKERVNDSIEKAVLL